MSTQNFQRVRLNKKLFLSLKPGQYIMGNFIPLIYEEIGPNPAEQWDNWSMVNGNTVNIFDSKEDCLKLWWELSSGLKLKAPDRAIFGGKLSKKVFLAQPDGYYILFTQAPFRYVELSAERESQWQQIRHSNGRRVKVFKNQVDCMMARSKWC